VNSPEIRVLFFAKWRELLGVDCIVVNYYALCGFKYAQQDANPAALAGAELSAQVSVNICDLIAYLQDQYDESMTEVLSHSQTKCALNQVVLSKDDYQSELGAGAEVAFFPPVTGG
jgi:molybdopterin converting factor small subunit